MSVRFVPELLFPFLLVALSPFGMVLHSTIQRLLYGVLPTAQCVEDFLVGCRICSGAVAFCEHGTQFHNVPQSYWCVHCRAARIPGVES